MRYLASFKQLALFLPYFKCHSFKLPLINFNFSPQQTTWKDCYCSLTKSFYPEKFNTSSCKGVGPQVSWYTYLVSNCFKYNCIRWREPQKCIASSSNVVGASKRSRPRRTILTWQIFCTQQCFVFTMDLTFVQNSLKLDDHKPLVISMSHNPYRTV